MKTKIYKTLFLILIIALTGACKIVEKIPEIATKTDPVPDAKYKVYYPYLPIESARDGAVFKDQKAVYDSLSNNIRLRFSLQNDRGSYYFGGSKPENKDKWCFVIDSVNGTAYPIGNFTVKEIIDLFDRKNAVSIVLDHSGSMGDRAYLLQDAVIEMIKNKRKEDAFGIIKFDTRIHTEVPFTTSRDELLRRFGRNGLSGYGGKTALNDALKTAVDQVATQAGYDDRIVLVFTDGAENSSIATLNSVIANAVAKKIKFYVIDFGNETDRVYNQRLARETNGKVYKIYQSVEINNIFNDIYGNMTMGPLMYEVAYTPEEPLGIHFPRIKLCFEYRQVRGEFNPVGFNQDMVLLNIQFAFNDYAIKGTENQKEISRVANYLKENPNFRIRLEGHTDCRGTAQFNKVLSENRAASVQTELIHLGIDRNRIDTKGFGFDIPHVLTADDLKKEELLRQNMVIGTELNCGLVNKIDNEALREATHQLNRRTKMVILR